MRWLQGVRRAESLGCQGILLSPDADTRTNAGICVNLTHAADDLTAKASLFAIETWLLDAGKGLDDVLHDNGSADLTVNGGISAWQVLKEWLASSGASRDPRVEARIVLDGVAERAEEDPSYPFRPGIAAAIGVLDAGSVEVQRLLAKLKALLKRGGWKDFEKKVREARAKRDTAVRGSQHLEVEARGGHVFRIGDQAEARTKLLDDLTPAGSRYDHGLCVFDRGALFKYDDGAFRKLDEAALITRVSDYSGSPIVSGGVLRVSSSFAKGTADLAYAKSAKPGFFDEAPAGVAFKNGFLFVDPKTKTVRLVPPSRDHRVRVRYEFDYIPGARPVRFLAALERYFRGDSDKAEKIACLQEFCGAAIVGEAPRFARAVVLRGTAGNDGKSTLAKILISAMPAGSVASVPPQRFDNDYSRASLDGILLNTVFELPEGDLVDAAPLKAIIVGDPIQARNPYQRPFDLKSRAGQLYICNRLFRVKDADSAFRRRWIILDFNDPLTPDEIDPAFAENMAKEIPQIVSWAMDGLVRRLAAQEYTIPSSSGAALNDWLREYDTLGAFLDDCVEMLDAEGRLDRTAWVRAKQLYTEYATWAKENGHTAMSSASFGTKLKVRLNLKQREVGRSEGNFYPMRIKLDRVIPTDQRMTENGETITAAHMDPEGLSSPSTQSVPHLRIVTDNERDTEDDDEHDDDHATDEECRRVARWAVGNREDML